MLDLQRKQGGRIAIDRYWYSQNYISHGLSKYLQMFDRPDVEQALIDNARSLYNVAPVDHDMESYLSSIHPLLVGYDLTGEDLFFIGACERARHPLVDELDRPLWASDTQRELPAAPGGKSSVPQEAGSAA